jgi:hypothetical protein
VPNVANRFGIALNFVAGFLLAPHLIGEQRLEAFERWATNEAIAIARAVQPISRRESERWATVSSASVELLVSSALWLGLVSIVRWIRGAEIELLPWSALWPDALILLVIFLPLAWFGTWLTAMDDLFLGGAAGLAGDKPNSPWLGVSNVMWKTAFFPLAFPFLVFQLAFLLVSRLLDLVASAIGGLARSLQKRRWLSGVLATLGVSFFTLGNGLQFWATYD